MNNDGKSGIRSGTGFADHLRALDRFLFGSSYDPPLDRRGFFREALIVLCVRMPIVNFLIWLVYRDSPAPNLLRLMFFTLPVSLAFYAPYFFVMYRRLAFLACPRPRLVTWAAVFALISCSAFLLMLLGEESFLLDLLGAAFFIAAYLPLLLISDRRPDRNPTLTSS